MQSRGESCIPYNHMKAFGDTHKAWPGIPKYGVGRVGHFIWWLVSGRPVETWDDSGMPFKGWGESVFPYESKGWDCYVIIMKV